MIRDCSERRSGTPKHFRISAGQVGVALNTIGLQKNTIGLQKNTTGFQKHNRVAEKHNRVAKKKTLPRMTSLTMTVIHQLLHGLVGTREAYRILTQRTTPGNEDSALDPVEIYGRNNPLRAYHDSKHEGEAVALSRDHKPMDDDERARIVDAGGFVQEGRVNGSLALSRAIGDLEYKQSKNLPAKDQIVTAYPEIRECVIEPGDEFMVIACDGIWDVLTSQQCVDYVRARLDADVQLSKICEELADECMAPDTKGSGIGCDNMSVVIVLLKDTAFVPGADGKPTLRPRSAF